MDNSLITMLKCDSCGHTWKPRNTPGEARQCSKCRSRYISIVEQDEIATLELSKPQNTPPFKAPTAHTIHPSLSDDPDIQAKMKELELIRIERFIVEEQKIITNTRAIECLAKAYIRLLDAARFGIRLDDITYEELASVCLFCGSTGDSGLEYVEEQRNDGMMTQFYRCKSCGVRVDI